MTKEQLQLELKIGEVFTKEKSDALMEYLQAFIKKVREEAKVQALYEVHADMVQNMVARGIGNSSIADWFHEKYLTTNNKEE